MKALLRWVGGKSWLAEQVRDALGPTGRYVVPFAGSIPMRLGGTDKGPAIIGDANADAMWLYRFVQTDPAEVNAVVQGLPLDWEAEYYDVRNWFNGIPRGTIERAGAFLWLNRSGFNGLIRYNRKGVFTVAVGRMKNRRVPGLDDLLEAQTYLREATIHIGDFRDTLAHCRPGDRVYLDSPYLPKNGDFVGYSADGFTEQDHTDLATRALELVELGCRVVVSNHDVPLMRELYPGFIVHGVYGRRNSISAGARVKTGEVLLVGGEVPTRPVI